METDTALVRPDGAAVLHPVSFVNLNVPFVIKPWNPEHDDSLRLDDPFKNLLLHQIWMFDNVRCNAFKHLSYCLVEFLFTRILGCKFSHEVVNVLLSVTVHFVVRFNG